MDVRLLVDYNHWLWRRFTDFLAEGCTWEEVSRNDETSHQSIANVTMHALNMEDWWLNYVLPGKAWDGPAWDSARSAEDLRRRAQDVEARTRKLLEGASDADLARPRRFRLGDEEGEATLEHVLAEVVNEATHHRGEVLAMLWRMDKEPPYASFLEYLQSR